MLCREDFDGEPISLDEIESGLWLGNRSSAMDPETLKSKKISHILTVDSSPLPDHVSQLKSIKKRLYIKLIDVAKEDLLDHLIDCFEFIDEALEDGGNVLVHCFYGVSRSASVIIAFLMQKYRLDYDQVFERVKEKRTSIGPNAGFVQQLKLFKLMDWMIDTDNKLYKTYMLRLAAVNIQKNLSDPADFAHLLHDDPEPVPPSQATEHLRCRKCRRILATDTNRLQHARSSITPNPLSAYNEHDGLLTDIVAASAAALSAAAACTENFFIEPMAWMPNDSAERQGRLHCPKCAAKVGSFDWTTGGVLCPCGVLVAPAFSLVPSKVEIARRFWPGDK